MKKLIFSLFIFVNFIFAKQVVIVDLWPVPSLLAFITKDANMVLIPKASSNFINNSLLVKFYPQLKNIKSSNNPSLEELLALNADLYICHINDLKICEFLSKSGKEVLKLTINVDNYNSRSALKHWLESLNKYFDIKQISDKLLSNIDEVEKEINLKLYNIKPIKAVALRGYDGNKIMTSTGFVDYLFKKTGATNAFKFNGFNNSYLNLEEFYSLNPDIIYITNFTPLQVEDIMQDKNLQNLKAVKNKKVFKLPLGSYRPTAPSLDLSLILKFLANNNHPELFNYDIKAEFKKHFKEFYDINLSENDLNLIMNPKREAGISK
ncbi:MULTISPECIES: ABC transporter substrate-binding protein [unclassified Campylobacter]|uniref:ABC transporter substrate-binding protein n=1 Tax=unclassified Campylobacter TaxID=2593542 RepID=UPI00123814E8|nr:MULTISPECIES: ABC transporter substrate-binding protein [unclassified Campylobacter]KAA6225401.1 ABC transporter substrate-binding protein [Campylobacter sp. LR185c]KAA6228723.1 ABC transporter substrate-binding protein [Campylobacter sp. LR286c]KAA6229533.1 ABC transporter substrate-binding protein [Campylobacter sp. LR264d]KAA6230777.1 ABC transporter substrate-binding protein [Campylobacter sp. LR291e]KAA8604908.1 hypothetical protein CGP82_00630 [Campylobacter sp. LR185c]